MIQPHVKPDEPSKDSPPRRVLQILHTDERGGIETLSSMIVTGLAQHNITVDTLYLYPSPGMSRIGKVRSIFAAARRLRQSDHDAIMAYQATASILTGVLGWLRGCPIRIVHQTAIPAATAWPLRLLDKIVGTLGFYTVNIANTRFTQSEFANYPAAYRKHMQLIVHAVPRPTTRHDRIAARSQFGLPFDTPIILNVGRMTAQKNQRVLINALPQVRDAILVIAGQGPDAQALYAQADARGVADRLFLLGAVSPSDVAELLYASDVFAFSSRWETFGLAAAEAAMTGIPMVVSDLPVLREVLQSESCPVEFVPPDDADHWAAALNDATFSPPLSPQRDEFANELAARYSQNSMTDRYVRLLSATI